MQLAGDLAGTAASPQIAAGAVTDAERRVVIAALNRLGRDDRLVIALRHFEQLGEAAPVAPSHG